LWLAYLASGVPGTAPWLMASDVTPVGTATTDLTDYVLSYGILGIFVVVGAILLYRGWQIMSPARLTEVRDEARADLLKENERLLAERTALEAQLAEARTFERDQLVPLLGNFTAATSSLLPVLQERLRDQEDHRGIERRPRR
jgi:hypothetical protein